MIDVWGLGSGCGGSIGKVLVRLALAGWLAVSVSGCDEGSASNNDQPQSQPQTVAPPEQPAPPPAEITNQPPEIDGVPDASVEAGQDYAFTPTASDPDQDFLEFKIANKPNWARFDPATGQLNGNPGDADVGDTADITITVTDGRAERSVGPFRIRIKPRGRPAAAANSAPTISGTPAALVEVGKQYKFQPSASDPDAGDRLTFAIANRPTWASFSTSSGTLSGTPQLKHAATYANIVISVSDGKAPSVSLPAFTISVKGPDNAAPTVSGTPATSVLAGQSYSFQPSAQDTDADPLTWSIKNKPAWATFSASTGRLSGTPTRDQVGSYANIGISVSDGKVTVPLANFDIEVQSPPNKAPTISGTPATTATVGTAYSFRPTAADADGDTLGYSVQNLPAWAQFSTSTGRLSGTPTTAGTSSNIVISVTDGKASASLAAFSIVVSGSTAVTAPPPAANNPPTISGTPATTAQVDRAYSFKPIANDPEGATLSWSVQGLPSWATFNTATGLLSGTPTVAGSYGNIVISVSDGANKASLQAFTITVAAAQLGSATMSWVAPTQNTDGSALNDLAGYRIVYGTSAGALDKTIQVNNPSVTSYVVENLTSATWYFAVKAYSSAGTESSLSNTASKTIP